MSSKLTTHILDTHSGIPAAGVDIALFRGDNLFAEAQTNAQGRCDAPLIEGAALVSGSYMLLFHLGAYFRSRGVESPFLDIVPVQFRMESGQSYHIPLLCSPWAYSTYRGN